MSHKPKTVTDHVFKQCSFHSFLSVTKLAPEADLESLAIEAACFISSTHQFGFIG